MIEQSLTCLQISKVHAGPILEGLSHLFVIQLRTLIHSTLVITNLLSQIPGYNEFSGLKGPLQYTNCAELFRIKRIQLMACNE